MFKKVNSTITGGLLRRKKDNDRVIIVYHWNNCGHCKSFMPILYDLLKKESELLNSANIFEVEYNDFKFLPKELTNISAFPSVISIEKGEKKDEFSDQRTPENLSKFIKSNSSVSSKRKRKILRSYSKTSMKKS